MEDREYMDFSETDIGDFNYEISPEESALKKTTSKKKEKVLNKKEKLDKWIKEKELIKDKKGLDMLFDSEVNIFGLYRMFSKGLGLQKTPAYSKSIYRIIEIANKIFKEAFYDFDIIFSKEDSLLSIVFHYPEIELENSVSDKHSIYNMYVIGEFIIAENGIQFHYLKGIRTTFTLAEIHSEYSHSHLKSDIKRVQKFCLGTRTPLDNLRKIYFNVLPNTSDERIEDYFFEYMINVENYINWESQEGGPYVYMDKIGLCINVRKAEFESMAESSKSINEPIFNILKRNPQFLKFIPKGDFTEIIINKEHIESLVSKGLMANELHYNSSIYLFKEGINEFMIKMEKEIIAKREIENIAFYFKKNIRHDIKIIESDKKHHTNFSNNHNYNWSEIFKIINETIKKLITH